MSVPDGGAFRSRPGLRVALAWLPALGYMALIWFVSSIPIELPLPSIPWRDKAAHVVQYGLLGLFVARAVRGTWPALPARRALPLAALITAGWGYLDELHQAFVPGRDASALDVLADVVGAVLGVAAYATLHAFLTRKRPAK
jgi:VanZ family protein